MKQLDRKQKNMEEIYKERLLKLYNHMANEKLSFDRFDFSNYKQEYSKENSSESCETLGCMAGELPIIFPEYWAYHLDKAHTNLLPRENTFELMKAYSVFLKESNGRVVYGGSTVNDLELFFHLKEEEREHLFSPNGQSQLIDEYFLKNKKLGVRATKEEVTENLRRFLVLKGII